MSNIGPTDGKQFFRDIIKRLTRLENNAGQIGAKAAKVAAAQVAASQQIFVGPTDPSPGLAPGTEYVWYKSNGSGTLIDTIFGIS